MVKINIAYPHMSRQKTIEIDDEHKMLPFYDKRMGAEVAADTLGDEWKGYLMKVSGGNDKQGFPMKQGVLTNGRKQLLFKKGMSCYRERRGGMRKRKTVRGCIVSHDLSILNLVVVKKGDAEVEGLTTEPKSRRLGPKRASKIRKLFGLEKADDVKKYVVRRSVKGEESKKTKAPKIQRLVTNARLQRKRRVKSALVKKVIANREEKTAYVQKMHDYRIRMKERRAAEMAKKKKGKAKKSE